MIKRNVIFVILALVINSAIAATYLDADDANTMLADGTTSQWSSTSISNYSDHLWDKRTGYGNNISGSASGSQTIYQAREDDCVSIATTVSGLTPEGLYHFDVVFWSKSASEDWGLRAGFSQDNLSYFNFTGIDRYGYSATAGDQTGVVQEGIYEMLGDLGIIKADASGDVKIYIDDLDADNLFHNYRSWYDGIRYSELETPYCLQQPLYDFNGDCSVNYADLSIFAQDWLAVGTFAPPAPGEAYTIINDNGGWCWFEDERAIIDDGKVVVGSVAAAAGTGGAARDGNIEVSSYDFATGETEVFVLHSNLQADDHDSPALLVLPDGHYLAMYAKHGNDSNVRYRISTNPHDITAWQDEKIFNATAGTTYSNVYQLSGENDRIYICHRAVDWNPTISYSDDNGQTWNLAGKLMTKSSERPYVRYASNNIDEIHFITTEGHPRDVNNSIYHGYVKGGKIYNSYGTLIDGNIYDNSAADPSDFTTIFAANTLIDGIPMTRCWTVDFELNSDGMPYAVFQARIDSGTLSGGGDSLDHLFFYASFDGVNWHVNKLAYAGRDIYAASPNGGEDDYTGLASLVPNDPSTVYISTNVDPVTGEALNSSADNMQHYEIFKGKTFDNGESWVWQPITENSTVSNYRPIVPESGGSNTALLWLSGQYGTYQSYDLDVVGLMTPATNPVCSHPEMDFNKDCVVNLADLAQFSEDWLSDGWFE